jgi:2-polyprenyl-3-methyl-5-hydroxy-6-metoxy-1,4-benzoquinol methylase
MTIESDRIRSVYAKRDDKKHLYVWHRPEIIYQEGEKNAVIAALLSKNHSFDLSESRVLDVGCGTGGFLRTLV